ncbi:hypothetical protein [Streptomyces massasporeus]
MSATSWKAGVVERRAPGSSTHERLRILASSASDQDRPASPL